MEMSISIMNNDYENDRFFILSLYLIFIYRIQKENENQQALIESLLAEVTRSPRGPEENGKSL